MALDPTLPVLDPGPLDQLRALEAASGRTGMAAGLVRAFLAGLPGTVDEADVLALRQELAALQGALAVA